MVYLFHDIKQKAYWERDNCHYPWLQEGELVADVFKGLRTTDGTLSTYAVDSEKTRINRVCAALVCTRASFQHIDYALIPFDAMADSFRLANTPGNTADDSVNVWHVDLVNLTPSKLIDLAYLIRNYKHLINRVEEHVIKSEIELGIEKRLLDCDKIKSKIRNKVCK